MTDPLHPASSSDDYVGSFAARVDVEPRTTCLVIVDLQHALASRSAGLGRLLAARGRAGAADYRFSRIEQLVVPNAVRLLDAFRRLELRRVFLTAGSAVGDYSDVPPHLRELFRATGNRVGAPEHDLLEELAPHADEPVLNKLGLSAFVSTPLDAMLRGWGTRTLVFAGITTNMCVEHNVRDAADRGFGCVLVDDACATDSQQMHDAALRNVARLYGRVAAADALVAELEAAMARA